MMFKGVNGTPQWKRLEMHAKSMKQTHLRDLLQDADRCNALNASHNGIFLDFARENVVPDTMVQQVHIKCNT
jgi:glucose-6-phosphate isomerase